MNIDNCLHENLEESKIQSDIAIVICTYNPEGKIFSRLLDSIKKLKVPEDLSVECIIVDNNSTHSLTQFQYIQDFLKEFANANVIQESKQGLSFARIAGVNLTTAPIIVFFDDDNEPDCNYLQIVCSLFDQYPNVAVWGPGKVSVEFIDPVSEWFSRNFKTFFQEQDMQYVEYGCIRSKWEKFYPFGTGLVIKRKIFEHYFKNQLSGQISIIDRQGNNLSSGGDIQIVWEAIKMGFAAGRSPQLKMNHIISGKRTNLQYIRRLHFGASASYMPALTQSFPSERIKALSQMPSYTKIMLKVIKIISLGIIKNSNDNWISKINLIFIDLAGYLGQVVGLLRVSGSQKNTLLFSIIKILKFE